MPIILSRAKGCVTSFVGGGFRNLLLRQSSLLLLHLLFWHYASASAGGGAVEPKLKFTPRDVFINGTAFYNASTGHPVVLTGANVVMKGYPWIPAVTGNTVCDTTGLDANTSCSTFNSADALHLTQDLGYNFVRLGVVWAGGQPRGPNTSLDPDFVARLHAFLDLCHTYGIAVLLDLHQDAVGTAVCGEGVPMWYSKLVTPGEIGKPIVPLSTKLSGACNGSEAWTEFASDPDYNILNPCCRQVNQGNWGALIPTVQAQATLSHLFSEQGRPVYADYVARLAQAVADYPAAIGIELMNEPPSIQREDMFRTWRTCYEAVRNVSAELAVGVMDTGQVALPWGNTGLSRDLTQWLETAGGIFYAFHWYNDPKTPAEGVRNAVKTAAGWHAPALLTEYGGYGSGVGGGCNVQAAAVAAGVGSAYWHYSDYCWPKHCPGGAPDGHCPLPKGPRWGACITGWGSGNSSFHCK